MLTDEQGNCCLPDGGHIFPEDWVYLFLPLKGDPSMYCADKKEEKKRKKKEKKKDKEQGKEGGEPGEGDAAEPECMLYGVAYFRNVPDPTCVRSFSRLSRLARARALHPLRVGVSACAT